MVTHKKVLYVHEHVVGLQAQWDKVNMVGVSLEEWQQSCLPSIPSSASNLNTEYRQRKTELEM